MGSGEMLWLNNKPRVSQIGCRAFSLADGQWSGKFSLVGKRICAVIGPQAGQARKAQFWLASRLGRQRKAQFWLAHRLNRKGKLNSDWPASWTDKRKLNSDWLGQISYLELRAGGLCWVDQGCLLEQQQLVVVVLVVGEGGGQQERGVAVGTPISWPRAQVATCHTG